MSDLSRVGPETETPVNPYSLLEAVNDSSDTAHTGWLIFLGIMTYLMIAVAGVTHQDLLLETPVKLPILQVDIQLTQFFQFAAVILVLFHLGLVSQLVLLARKTLEFDHAIRLLETTHRRTHPLRLELHNFFFVQAIAGPHRSHIMSGFLHAMSWLTLVILPVVLILYIQIVFLPYHDEAITWMHRIVLLADIGMLVLIGVFLMRAETSFFQAFWRTTTTHPLSFAVTTVVLAFVTLFSLFGATVPGEPVDLAMQRIFNSHSADAGSERRFASGFTLPFFGARADGTMFGLFYRNIHVQDADLVVDKDAPKGEVTLNLRGRDLRYARLNRSDLHQADLTGANLEEAKLAGADLHDVRMQCGDITSLLLSENRAAADCASARGADFTDANLTNARMSGIDLRQAKLDSARLDGAELPYALLTGTEFNYAHLEKADLTGGVLAQGAVFRGAFLQGAALNGAQLQFADFSSATMQAAILQHAHLEGADLNLADLEASTLSQAVLHGADLTGANLAGADLRGASVWMTSPPATAAPTLADFGGLRIEPLNEEQTADLNRVIGRIEDNDLRQAAANTAARFLDGESSQSWGGSQDHQTWQTLAASPQPVNPESYKSEITDYLASLMCKTRWRDGAVATGVARRALMDYFRGDPVAIHDRLKEASCPSSTTVLPQIMRALGDKVNLIRND